MPKTTKIQNILFIALMAVICLSFKQKENDSLEKRPPAIVPVVSPDNNATLLQYEKLMADDIKEHREYIEGLYRDFIYFLGIVGTICGVLLVFFGRKSFKEWKRWAEQSMNKLYDEHSKKFIDEMWQAKLIHLGQQTEEWRRSVMADHQKEIEELKKDFRRQTREIYDHYNDILAKIEKQLQLNTDTAGRQESALTSINLMFRELADKLDDMPVIRKSRVKLKYLNPEGSVVEYSKYQELVCEDNDKPIKRAIEGLALAGNGKITAVEPGDKGRIEKQEINSVMINYQFDKPILKGDPPFKKEFKCKFIDAFTGQREWFTISQVSTCTDETYELQFLPERPCRDLYLEKLDLNGNVLEQIRKGIVKDENINGVCYTINIPVQQPPYKCRIVWEF